MTYLDFDEVLAIHDRMLQVGGGGQGVRDFALMHSAMERPRASFGGRDLYPTIYLKGAALMHSFVHNHAFADANKRTAFACTIRFLFLNGYSFSAEKDEIIKLTMDVEAKKLGLKDIALWLKQHSKPFKKRSPKTRVNVKVRHYSDKEVQHFLDLDKKETRELKAKRLLQTSTLRKSRRRRDRKVAQEALCPAEETEIILRHSSEHAMRIRHEVVS